MRDRRDRLGLTVTEVRRLTGREWLPYTPEDDYEGPGVYCWFADLGRGQSIYPGKGVRVLERLAAEAAWSESADEPGYEALSRLICRYACAAFYSRTGTEAEALDVEAIVFWATVHFTGHPPLASGGAWPPRTPRGLIASDIALRWVEQELSSGEAA